MTEETFEIFFSDLTPEAQKRLLEASHLNSAEEANWDTFPIASLPLSSEEERQE